MQRQMQPDAVYGQTDAMELTPSVASFASSQQRNMSRDGLGVDASANKSAQLGSEPRFGDGFDREQAQVHFQSNDSIMNPRIRAAGAEGGDDSGGGDASQAEMARENSDIHILDQYPQSHREDGSASISARQSGAKPAIISLTALQSQYNNNHPVSHSSRTLVVPDDQPVHKQSGYFGSQDERSAAHHSQSYKPLDFQHIDEEEQYLDEQYRQLSQHQRAPATGSKQASSRMLPPTSFDAGNSVRNMSLRVTQGAGSSSRFSRGNSIAGTMTNEEHTGRNTDLPRSQTPSEAGEVSHKQYMSQPAMSGGHTSSRRAGEQQQHSMSQQSLLNRNTSPFNQHISNTHSDQQPEELQIQSNQRSATSANHREQPPAGNDEICRKLQTKIKQQAERLIQLQKAANNPQPNNSEEIEQLRKALQAKDETINEMQMRNVGIAKGMMSQSQMKERLIVAEENLRAETAVNEEQRAQIAILKQGIEANLQRLGLRFSPGGANQTGSLSQIDGYIQLMRYSQINEKQHSQIQTLNDQLAHFDERHLNALKEAGQAKDREIAALRSGHQEQLRAKERTLIDLESKGAQLKTQKDELLDFVEQNQAKTRQLEDRTRDLSSKFDALVLEKDAYKSQYEDLVKQKKNQDELLEQVKQNLQDMRSQREQLNGEVGALKRELGAINQELSQSQDLVKDKDAELSQLNNSLADKEKLQRTIEEELNTTVDGKRKELNGIRTKMEIWQESLAQKDQLISQQRGKITELKNRQFALEETNEQLKRTLKGSQGELVGLLEAHELLTQKHSTKSQDGLLLTAEISRLKQEIAEKKLLVEKFQTRLNEKGQEMKSIQSTLGDRDRAHLDNERSFRQDLRHRDESTHDLLKRTKQLESRLADQSAKLEYLDKVRSDYAAQEKHLKQTIEMKQETAKELSRELTSLKNECARQTGLLEQTLSEQMQTKDQREMRMTQQIDAMSVELRSIKADKERLDHRLAERAKKFRELEYNEQCIDRETSKWKDDMARLEAELKQSKEQAASLVCKNEVLNKEKIEGNERIEKLESGKALMTKTIKKIESKLSKFCKQISRVENLEKRYASLGRVVQEHEQVSEEQDAQKTLESIQKCFDLMQSQVKNLIILNETMHSDTSFEAKLDLIQQDKIPQRDTALRNQKSIQSLGNAELLKATIQDQESHLKIEKDIKYQYEICLNAVSQMLCLKSEFRQLLVTLVQGLKSLYQHKQESRTISLKLLSSEQRYTEILNDIDSDKLFKNQMVSLKQIIEKDRLQLNHLERKINSMEDELANQLNDLIRADKAYSEEDRGSEVKLRALEVRLQEMKNNFEEANSKKDWVEAKLQEIQQQMTVFQVNDSGTSNQLSYRSNRSQRRNMSTRKQDRPSSAWSDQRGLNHALPPSVPQREKPETQNILRGEDVQVQQQLKRDSEEIHATFRINQQSNLDHRDTRPHRGDSRDRQSASRNDRDLLDIQGGSTLTMGAVEPRAQNTSAARSSRLLGMGSHSTANEARQSNERNLRAYASMQPYTNTQSVSSRQALSHHNLQSEFGKALARQINEESSSKRFENALNPRQKFEAIQNPGQEQLKDSLQQHEELSLSLQNEEGMTSHKRAPTELSVRNILMQRFSGDGGMFGNRLEKNQEIPYQEAAEHTYEEKSNKYKRGLTASRSPYRQQSNERIPSDIHQYERNEEYIDLNNQNRQDHGGDSARSDEYFVDSIGASSIPYKQIRQVQIQGNSSPRTNGSRSQDRSQELQWSGVDQARERDNSGEGAEAYLDQGKSRPLRGPRSASKSSKSRSPKPKVRYQFGSNKSKESSSSPHRPQNDLAMPPGCYLLPLQRNDQYPSKSSYIQTEDVNTRERSAHDSLPLSFVQTNESRQTSKPFGSNPSGYVDNKFDKIDNIRLQNQLSNEKINRGKFIGE